MPVVSIQEKKELIEAGFVGIYASITFHENRSLNSSFEIQRLWVTNHMPGEDTASFQDPTCVLRPELQEPTELCTRCNVAFDVEHNPATACVFHADDDGNPGMCKPVASPPLSAGAYLTVYICVTIL